MLGFFTMESDLNSELSEPFSDGTDSSGEEFSIGTQSQVFPKKVRKRRRKKSASTVEAKDESHRVLRVRWQRKLGDLTATRKSSSRNSINLSSSYSAKSTIRKSFISNCKPCYVDLHRLTPEFIQDALDGRIKWSVLRGRQRTTDLESIIREKMRPKKVIGTSTYERNSNRFSENGIKSAQKIGKKRKKSKYHHTYDSEHSDEEKQYSVSKRRSLARVAPSSSAKISIKCKDCSFTSDDPEVLLLHTGLHKNFCSECDLNFENKFKFQKHVYETHKPPVELRNKVVFGCKFCQEYFDAEGQAQLHICSHMEASGDGKLACMLCKLSYSKESTLTNHLISKHLLYKCTFCEFLAPTFDILERHSSNAHSAYGRPYSCDLCDFRSSAFGSLLAHRKTCHGLDREGDHERCTICAYLLVSDKETILEHLAGHANFSLFECQHCDNLKISSFSAIREHGMNFHASHDISSFATIKDLSELMKIITKIVCNRLDTNVYKRQQRGKPSNTETKDAVAKIYSPEVSSTFDSLSSSFDRTSSAETCQNYGYYAPEFQEPTPLLQSSLSKQPDSSCDPSMDFFNENLLVESQIYPQDPLSVAMQSVNSNGILNPTESLPKPTEGVLSVDPVSGQLFLQGLPVLDEGGNPVLVQLPKASQKPPSSATDNDNLSP